MKKKVEKEKLPPEKYWQKLVDVYFAFYKDHFRDPSGYKLEPDWAPHKRGMEAKGLKGIITRLRTIAEEKEIEWTEDYASHSLYDFLEKAYKNTFYRKSFMCCLLNKFKDQIIITENNSELEKKILEEWYLAFPNYSVNRDSDVAAADKTILFLKEQFRNTNIPFSEASAIASFRVIIEYLKTDEFWMDKSLKSISNNLQEFVNKIKANKNGKRPNPKTDGIEYAFNQAFGRNQTPGF